MTELNQTLADAKNEAPFTVEQITFKYDSKKKKWVILKDFEK